MFPPGSVLSGGYRRSTTSVGGDVVLVAGFVIVLLCLGVFSSIPGIANNSGEVAPGGGKPLTGGSQSRTSTVSPAGSGADPFNAGDLFVAVGQGKINRYDSKSALQGVLDTGTGSLHETGMCFDSDANLYATDFTTSSMSKFNNQGGLTAQAWGGPFNINPENCLVVKDKTTGQTFIYTGEVDGDPPPQGYTPLIRKFDTAGNLLATFSPAIEKRGIDWMDLASDQCTMFYTSEGMLVKRFNVCTNTQLADFAALPTSPAYALRIRPNGEVLVATSSAVQRLDTSGRVLQTYTTAGVGETSTFFALALNPDKRFFWVGGYSTGNVYKIDLASGIVLLSFTAPVTAASDLSGLAVYEEPWVSLGPSPIQTCQFLVDLPAFCSGRVSAIALDPTDATGGTVYLGAASGGVWKSTNAGASWTSLTDNQPSWAVGSIAVDATGTVYVGTGEGNGCGDSYYGAGILKSRDGGSTWTRLGVTTFGQAAISKVIVNGSIVIASTVRGCISSSTGRVSIVTPVPPLGVYVSTDSGGSWMRTLVANTTLGATDLALDPTNRNIVYAAVDGTVYVSNNSGAASSWSALFIGAPAGVSRISLGISRASPNLVFAAMNPAQLWKITVTSVSPPTYAWSNIAAPSFQVNRTLGLNTDTFCGEQCSYNLYIAVDPVNSNVLYLGGLDVYRTTNGDSATPTWTDLGGGAGSNLRIHTDQHAFAFDTTSSTSSSTVCSPTPCTPKIYVGNDGGIWSSSAGETIVPPGNPPASGAANCSNPPAPNCWTNLNQGLSITQFQFLAAHPTDPNTYFGGTQDNGIPGYTATPGNPAPFVSSMWTELQDSDGGWTGFDRTNPSEVYLAFNSPNAPRRWDIPTSAWVPMGGGLSFLNDCRTVGCRFYVPMSMDLTVSTTLYLGTYRLYKASNAPTCNNTACWALSGLDLTANWPCNPVGGPNICGIISAISATTVSGKSYVFVGTSTGSFFASNDGGTSFSEIDSKLPLTPRLITKIAIDPRNATRIFVTFSGFVGLQSSHVFNGIVNFANTPATADWIDISTTLPDIPANAITLDPGGNIYVGTDTGVFESTDNGASWLALGSGLPTVPVFDLVISADGSLLAATHGRGVWGLPFHFALSNSGSVTVFAGGAAGVFIGVGLASGTSQSVVLSCMAPPGVSCSFSGAPSLTGSPSFSTVLTLSPSALGTFTIVVTGMAKGQTQTTQFTLTVLPGGGGGGAGGAGGPKALQT